MPDPLSSPLTVVFAHHTRSRASPQIPSWAGVHPSSTRSTHCSSSASRKSTRTAANTSARSTLASSPAWTGAGMEIGVGERSRAYMLSRLSSGESRPVCQTIGRTVLTLIRYAVDRYMGGLLGAYDLSGDKLLLDRAEEIGKIILPIFDTSSGVPMSQSAQLSPGIYIHGCLADMLLLNAASFRPSEPSQPSTHLRRPLNPASRGRHARPRVYPTVPAHRQQ